MKVCLTVLLVLQLSVAVLMSAMSEDECIDFKEKYLRNEIEISDMRSENSRLKSEIYYLSKQVAEFFTETENCSAIAANVDETSASLTNIQKKVWQQKMLFDKKFNSTNIQTDKENLLIENSSKTEQLLIELKNIKDNLTTAAGQFSESLNASLMEFQNKTKMFEVSNLITTSKIIDKLKKCVDAVDNNNLQALPFSVVRDEDSWIVVLRRIDGTVNFERGWEDYKAGFGDPKGNYFMGLETIYQLTTSQCYELKVVLEDFDYNRRFALYDRFAIANEDEGYALNKLGNYSGTAGDSLNTHRGMKFSTFDKDNDKRDAVNCAEYFKGAWWHNDCYNSKLTGIYIPGGDNPNYHGIDWRKWRDPYSYKSAKMLIRQIAC